MNLENSSNRLKDSWIFNLNSKEIQVMLKLKSTTRTSKEQWLLRQLEIVQVNILNHLHKIQSTVALETCLSKINQKRNKKVPNNRTLKQTLTKKLQPKVTKHKKLLNKKNHKKRKKLRNQKNKLSKTLVTTKLKMKTPIISRVMMLPTDNQRSSSWVKMMKMMMTIMATAILILIRIQKRMGIVMMITIMKMNKKRLLKMKLLTY